MNRLLILVAISFFLVSCFSLDESIGITENDNAIQCIKADGHSSYPLVSGNISTSRIEFPAWMKDADLSDATIEDLVLLFTSIAAIVEAMDCPG